MNTPEDKIPEPQKSGHRLPPLTWFALLTSVWLAVSAAFAFQVSALGFAPWSRALTFALLDWGPWIIFSPLVFALAIRLPINPKTWRWALPIHLVACLAVIVLIEVSMSLLSLRKEFFGPPRDNGPRIEHMAPPADGQGQPEGMPEPGRGTVSPGERMPPRGPGHPPFFSPWFRLLERARFAVPIYWMLVAIAHAVAQQRRSVERERRALRAEALLSEARLMALQAQLNPHFLFNTLNTITQLVYDNPQAAEEMITALSELLRAVLAAQSRREVSLDEELELLERYFSIQKVRFADRLDVRYEIEPAVNGAAVPTLLLQPLAENAIKHGITPSSGPGTVTVRARSEGGNLCIEISDTGAAPGGAPDEAGRRLDFTEGVGLSNTRARLETLYPGRHAFDLERAREGGVLARVILPLRRIS